MNPRNNPLKIKFKRRKRGVYIGIKFQSYRTTGYLYVTTYLVSSLKSFLFHIFLVIFNLFKFYQVVFTKVDCIPRILKYNVSYDV